jgi:DNA-3-methyladenine glycosylase I
VARAQDARPSPHAAAAPSPRRCPWCESTALYRAYHDREWGVPNHDDRRWFEILVLDGAQAGLSWRTILEKREGYRRAFARFDPVRVARFDARRIRALLADPGIVRNRLKIESAVSNARAFLEVQREFGSFDRFLWGLVGVRPIQNRWRALGEVPARTPLSDALSAELRRRGFRFVGSTICYAMMQAAGMVNDHLTGCFRHREVRELARGGGRGGDRPAVGGARRTRERRRP